MRQWRAWKGQEAVSMRGRAPGKGGGSCEFDCRSFSSSCTHHDSHFLRRGQSPAPTGEERIRYTKLRQFFIPFSADPKRPINELRLFVQRNGGEWEYLTSAQPNQKGFNFFTNQDGTYAMTVQTVYQDGSTEPCATSCAPISKSSSIRCRRAYRVRPFSTPDGAAGVEWDIVDDYIDASSIRLEYRWPGMVDWAPIDKGVQFKARDQRTWVLKPDQRIEIRVKAADLAKNEAISNGRHDLIRRSATTGNSAAPTRAAVRRRLATLIRRRRRESPATNTSSITRF